MGDGASMSEAVGDVVAVVADGAVVAAGAVVAVVAVLAGTVLAGPVLAGTVPATPRYRKTWVAAREG